MICAHCGAENPSGAKFCNECATRLAAPCPGCGTENPLGAKFCSECATALVAGAQPSTTAPSPTSVAERRLVSVLFADLVGFTPFAEERDAEEVRSTLESYSDVTRQVVERYGGTVEKFIGDAVMAVWGTPTAHEDDAERAVRAALELTDLVRTLGPGIQARAGVLTGEAAVTVGATNQGMVAGDLVNTAARLQSVAPPGAVLVGEATMKAASAALAFEPAGEQTLKGKAAPVRAWRAVRVVAQRRGAKRSETVETPFVGRDEESRLLRDLLHLAGRDPRARLVSVTGPAGIGKSRLAWELEKYVDGVVETIYWHRGRCPAYGEGVTFWALGEMVRERCRLAETDDDTTTRQRLAATVDEYVTDEGERAWIESALLALLGIEQTPQGGREMLFAAWRRFFENVAFRGTTVLVFEDLHWADSGLLDFIDHLLDWSKDAPLLVVTLARPELFDRRPNWSAGRRTLTALALDPLSEAHMRELLAGLVPHLPEPTVRTIVERADGIPLYAVETVRMLLADGRLEEVDGGYRPTRELGDLAVPESLRSLITSRLDALDAADRVLLQDASVLGLSFTLDALAAVSGNGVPELEARLRPLVRRELLTLEANPRSPERGQYGFMQSLTREVAYSTLARPDRRVRHLSAARHYEATGGDETAGVLASHYLAAHEASSPGREAEAVGAQARIALRAAADRAAALGGHEQAAAHLERSLSVTTEPGERAALLERQAVEADLAGRYERGETVARAAIQLYRELGAAGDIARARGVLGTVLIHASRIKDAIAELEPAVAELPEDADSAVRADALAKLARAYYRNLDSTRSIETADQALVIAEHHGLRRTLGEALVSKGTALSMSSRPNEAMMLLRGGMDLARREGDVATALRGAANLSYLVSFDSAQEALQISREALQLARTVGDLGSIVWQLGNVLVNSCFTAQRLDDVLAEGQELLSLELEPGDRAQLLGQYLVPALLRGDEASAMLQEYLNSDRVRVDPQGNAEGLWLHTVDSLSRGDYAATSGYFEQSAELRPDWGVMGNAALYAAIGRDAGAARRLVEGARSQPLVGRGDETIRLAAQAAVSALEGRPDEALAKFRESMRRLREIGDMFDLGITGLAMLRTMGSQTPEAVAGAEEALAIFEQMGAEPLVAQLRAALGEPTDARSASGASAIEAAVEV